jgi:glycosyltransferase involved in cell wall biosynthesis
MNILVFSLVPTHQSRFGTAKRILNYMSRLKELGHNLHLVHFGHVKASPEEYRIMSGAWESVTLIEKTIDYKKTGDGYFRVDDWYQEGSGEIVASLCSLLSIDMVITNYVFFSKIFDYVPRDTLKVLDTIDKLSDRNLMFSEKGIAPDQFWTTAEEEILALNRADIVLAIQDEERKYFETVTEKPVITLGHYEPSNLLPEKSVQRLKKIGFLGGPNLVNSNSLKEFIPKFSQAVKDHQLDIEFHIFGGVCNFFNGLQEESIFLRGFVDDVKEVYEQCDLIINPLTVGTGLKIKTIEALSYGSPIISTAIGFEGIPTSKRYFLFSNLDEMIAEIVNCYKAPEKLAEIRQSSIEVFFEHQAEVGKSLQTILAKVAPSSKKSNSLGLMHHDPFGRLQTSSDLDLNPEIGQYAINSALLEMAQISIIKSPIKKLKAYKKLLQIFERSGY